MAYVPGMGHDILLHGMYTPPSPEIDPDLDRARSRRSGASAHQGHPSFSIGLPGPLYQQDLPRFISHPQTPAL